MPRSYAQVLIPVYEKGFVSARAKPGRPLEARTDPNNRWLAIWWRFEPMRANTQLDHFAG